MKTPDLDRVFAALRGARVAVLGDFCVDHYLFLDPGWKELSLETGLPVRGVIGQRLSPGGAGNVAANAAALGLRAVHCLGCLGDDLYGAALQNSLHRLGCDTSGLLVQPREFATHAYVKPYRGGEEGPRFDHGVANRVGAETTRRLVASLERLLPNLDTVLLNQQVATGVWSAALIESVNALIPGFPSVPWVVDSRHRIESFRGAVMKMHAGEAVRLSGRGGQRDAPATAAETRRDLDLLFARFAAPIVITRGNDGAIARDREGTYAVPGVRSPGEIDPVGAGDTFLAALGAGLGGGLGLATALEVANLAAAVTVRKLRQTGTASEAEIRALAADASNRDESARPRSAE
ncbi:MAG: PfkB family carbohydrate kinase [Planctomycetota bacterium]